MQMPGQGRFAMPRWGAWLVVVSLAILAACAVWIGLYTHPQADDYNYATLAREHGIWGGQYEYYMNWNGRALASALCFLALGGEMPLWVYHAGPAAVLACLLLSFRCFVGAIVPRGVGRGPRWLTAAALTALYFTGAVSTREGFYWLSGSLNYQPSHCLGLLLAAVLLRRQALGGAPVLAFGLALLMAMANESGMLVEVLALAVGTAVVLLSKHANRKLWVAALVGCVIGMALDLGAPGLRSRSALHDANSEHAKDLLWSLGGSFRYSAAAALRLAVHPAFWGVLLLGLPWLLRGDGSLRWRMSPVTQVLIPVMWLGLAAAALFPVQFASGVNPPGRIANVASWVLVGGALPASACVVALVLRGAALRDLAKRLPGRPITILGVVALSAGLYLNTNALRLFRDLPAAPEYSQEMAARTARILQLKQAGEKHVRIPPLETSPGTICYHDQPDDPENWHNKIIARYFGVESIATERKAR